MPTQKVKDSNVKRLTERLEKNTKALEAATRKEAAAVTKRENLERAKRTIETDLAFWTGAPVDGEPVEPAEQEALFDPEPQGDVAFV